MIDTHNPRAHMGDNTANAPDYAKDEVERLQRDYGELVKTVDSLTAEAEVIPEAIPDDDVKGTVVDLIKRIRDAKVRVEAFHMAEKQPFLRRGQGVDQFFFGVWDRLMKRAKNNRDGIADVLLARLTAYDVRKLAEEQERRRKEAAEAERIRVAAEAERIRLEQAAEEARLAAERARKPETTAAKTAAADVVEASASAARVEESVAASAAQQSYVDTLARPADIMRTRTAGGTLSTMATEPYANIVKVGDLDAVKLWAFVPFPEKEKALRAWAKATGHGEVMAGADIGRKPKSQVR